VSTLDSERFAVLSPHPDDAVFSAFHVLTAGAAVEVIVIFAGIPGGGFVTGLDRSHGATESAAWVQRRLDEDAAVMRALSCRHLHLDFLDAQYRAECFPQLRAALEADVTKLIPLINAHPEARADIPAIVDAILPDLPSDSILYAPLGIGGHPDHVDVGHVAMQLVERGWRVRLYADSPYFLRSGPPTWVTQVRNTEADRCVDEALTRLLPSEMPRRRSLERLTLDAAEAKIAMAKRYSTEFTFIDKDFNGIPSDPNLMRVEPYWEVGAGGTT
jgi:LmbE family N-acetylglucosaminyl deacetylase